MSQSAAHSGTTWSYLFTGIPSSIQCIWTAVHLFLPVLYRRVYEAKFFLPVEGFSYYHSCLRIENAWRKRVTDLQTHWELFKKISIVLLGFVAPYLSTTKASIHSFTFITGSLCIFHSFTGASVSYVYTSYAAGICNPVVIDYWLEASSGHGGMYFWTLLSLPTVWFVTAISYFLGFIIASVWEDTIEETYSPSDTSALWHKTLLFSSIAWAGIHFYLVFLAWSRIKTRH